jgi:hypothetical protein
VKGDLDAVYVVYAKFNSALSTPPTTMPPPDGPPEGTGGAEVDYILEPGADEILDQILPLYVRNSVYRALVETSAAEHGARRTAMKNATDNAGDILQTLTRTYNRIRQAAITQEIAEIVGGAAALDRDNTRIHEPENIHGSHCPRAGHRARGRPRPAGWSRSSGRSSTPSSGGQLPDIYNALVIDQPAADGRPALDG